MGQTIVAMLLFENLGMIYYFPILILFGLGAGVLVGAAAGFVYTRIFPTLKGRYTKVSKELQKTQEKGIMDKKA